VLITEWIDRIFHITLNRPERRNALDHQTLDELRAAQRAAAEGGARVVVLSGAAPAFCAGADLSGVEDDVFVATLRQVLEGFGELDAVTIAAMDGPALGAGTQLAVACDLRMATADTVLGIPAAKLGIAVDRWTIDRMTRELGWSISRNMLLAASTYTGAQLESTGFVHRLGTVPEALDWAARLAGLAPLTIAAHKRGLELLPEGDAGFEDIEAARLRAWRSADAAEGVAAFAEKRSPQFSGE
jgi:enoyl-CoA hydratase